MKYENIQLVIDRIMQNKYLAVIKEAIGKSYMLIIVGSLSLLVLYIPLPNNFMIKNWINNYNDLFIKIYYLSMGLMSLYTVISMGYLLSKEYGLKIMESSLVCVFAFIISFDSINEPFLDKLCYSLFLGIITTILTIKIIRLSLRFKDFIKVPKCVPKAIESTVRDFIPSLCIIIFFGVIFPISSIFNYLSSIINTLLLIIDSLPFVLIVIFLITFCWMQGLHGVSVITMLLNPFWVSMILYNGHFLIQGSQQFFIFPEPFLQWFVWIGGSGATLGLSFLLRYVCSSKHCKEIGYQSWNSSIFNINEPIIFGLPVVSNKVFVIPFIIIPMICATLSWYFITKGIVMPMRIVSLWILPSPLGAYISTLGDVNAILFNLVLIVLSTILYLPFVMMYDKVKIKEEKSK